MYTFITGPSTVGKTTYARKHYPDIPIIDSDEVWKQLVDTLQTYDRTTILSHLFHTIHEQATAYPDAIVVHTDATPLLTHFNRSDVTIVLVVTPLKRLTRNLVARKNRPTHQVLGHTHTGYLHYFEPTDSNVHTGGSFYVKRSDVEALPAHTKKDARAIRTFIEAVFKPKRKSARLQPRENIEFDVFVIV